MRLRPALILISVWLGGCAVGPDYERPEIESPEDYNERINQGAAIANAAWWTIFEDAELNRLITIALDENKDLAIAAARVEEARARAGFARGDFYPQIGVNASGQRGNQLEAIFPDTGIQNNYGLTADLVWEIDLFGRIRRSSKPPGPICWPASMRDELSISPSLPMSPTPTSWFATLMPDWKSRLARWLRGTTQPS